MNLPKYQNCVLDLRFFLGSFRDYSGQDNHGTPTGVHFEKRPDKHVKFMPTSTDKITVADSSELQGTEFTFIFYGDFDTQPTANSRLCVKGDGSGRNYDIITTATAGQVAWQDSATALRTATLNYIGSKSIAVSGSNGVTPKGYVDGAFVSNFSGTVTVTADDPDVIIGNNYIGNFEQPNPLKGVLIYNTVLTAAEIAQAHEWIMETKTPSYPKKNFKYPSQITGKETGLVFGADMKNVHGKVIDKTGNGNDGAIVGARQVEGLAGDALDFTTGNYVSIADATSIQDISPLTIAMTTDFRTAGDNNAGRLIEKINRWRIYNTVDNNLVFFKDFDGATDGSWVTNTGAFTYGEKHRVVITYDDSSVNNDPVIYIDGVSQNVIEASAPLGTRVSDVGSNLIIGNNSDTPIRAVDGAISEVEIINGTWSQTDVTADYKKYAKLPYFIDDLKDANESVAAEGGATGTFLSNTAWRFGDATARYKISRDETLGVGQKVIECDTAGALGTPFDRAYGTIEFDINHADTAQTGVQLCALNADYTVTGNTGYLFRLQNSEALIFYRMNGGGSVTTLFSTATSYISHSTWYKIRITRRYDGQFTWYIKGGAFTDWTTVVVASGSNPVTDTTYTTAKWLTLTLGVGDKISNIKFYEGVLTP